MYLLSPIILSILFLGCLDKPDSTKVKRAISNPPEYRIEFQDTSALENQPRKFVFSYDLRKEEKVYEVPKELEEISGITFTGPNELSCVQDEKGNVYQFSLEEEDVIHKIDFGKGGDYEGIAFNGSDIVTMRSDGKFYTLNPPFKEKMDPAEYGPFLTDAQDAEGFCWLDRKNTWLIACKGNSEMSDYPFQKVVLELHPKKMEILPKPFLIIAPDEIRLFILEKDLLKQEPRYEAFFDSDHGNDAFQPSDIAVNPKTGDLYIISSARDKFMLVYSVKGKLLHIETLDDKLLEQPEGICFDNEGNLFIASEGKSKSGLIVKYPYLKKN